MNLTIFQTSGPFGLKLAWVLIPVYLVLVDVYGASDGTFDSTLEACDYSDDIDTTSALSRHPPFTV